MVAATTSAPQMPTISDAQDRATLTRVPALAVLMEHLNAALAHGETLLGMHLALTAQIDTGATVPAILRQNQALDGFARNLLALELALIARLVQARTCAAEAKRQDKRLVLILQLILGGTAVIADVAVSMTQQQATAFDTGGHAPAFLRARGVLFGAALVVTEDYLVHGSLHLGTLMDLSAVALDKIDVFLNEAAEPIV
jgi:hypothetical protein